MGCSCEATRGEELQAHSASVSQQQRYVDDDVGDDDDDRLTDQPVYGVAINGVYTSCRRGYAPTCEDYCCIELLHWTIKAFIYLQKAFEPLGSAWPFGPLDLSTR